MEYGCEVEAEIERDDDDQGLSKEHLNRSEDSNVCHLGRKAPNSIASSSTGGRTGSGLFSYLVYRDRKDKYTKGLEDRACRSSYHQSLAFSGMPELLDLLRSALNLLAQEEVMLPPELFQYAHTAQNPHCQWYAHFSAGLPV